MYKLFLTIRYLRKRRIARVPIIGVAVCVMMVVVVISVMGGFLDTIKKKSRGLLSDIIIDNASLQGFPFYEQFEAHLAAKLPDVVQTITPVIYNYGILRVESSYTKTVQVVGIRLSEYKEVNDFQAGLYYDTYFPGTTHLAIQQQPFVGFDEQLVPRLPDDHEAALARWIAKSPNDPLLDGWKRTPEMPYPGPGVFQYTLDDPPGYYGDPAPGIITGVHVINDRSPSGQVIRISRRGDKLLLMLLPITRGGRLSAEGSATIVGRHADDSSTGVFEFDEKCCYVDFDLLQKWLAMDPQLLEDGGTTPARTSQLLVSLKDGADLNEARKRISDEWDQFVATLEEPLSLLDRQMIGFVSVQTWEERQASFIAALEKEKILMTILFALISLVAVLLIGCVFWMIVYQKTRDIGIIKSLGGSSAGVAAIFMSFGAAVGVVGSILGVIGGTMFVWYINDIQDFLEKINPRLRVWSPDVYTFDQIPNVVKPQEVTIIAVTAILASVLGALIPAILAGRVWPVKALRYE